MLEFSDYEITVSHRDEITMKHTYTSTKTTDHREPQPYRLEDYD